MRTVLTTLILSLSAAALGGCPKSKTTSTGAAAGPDMQAAARAQAAAEERKASGQEAAKAQAGEGGEAATGQTAGAPPTGRVVEIKTSKGAITIELYPDKAPKTVANFLGYVKDKFYDGTVFHRVIDNFMVQGGGFDSSYNKKPTRAPVENEADNGLKNAVGTVAMARTPDPHSASAQFFINTKNNEFLNFRSKTPEGWGYTVFGKVTSGMDVVNQISKTKTGAKGPFGSDVPLEDVVIESARIVE